MTNALQLLNCTPEELKEIVCGYGEKPYRADQLFEALHRGKKTEQIENLPLSLRRHLSEDTIDQPVAIEKVFPSKLDDTVKFIYRMSDGNCVEGVLMHYKYGRTLCVSTQVGCRMGCRFCASTLEGKARDLSAGEILGQIICANGYLKDKDEKVHNVVLMGSGEPFDNYDNVVRFLHLVNHPKGINIGLRHISLSTCGLVPEIRRFTDEGLPVTLSLSLHAPTDDARKRIMPVANAYTIPETIEACKGYFAKTGRRIIIEYALIDGVNCSDRNAADLIALLKGGPFHVNLIALNSVKERELNAPGPARIKSFFDQLEKGGISVTMRRSLGQDIDGACGQLRKKYLERKDEDHGSY